ncbi:hypothetical protein KCU83_g9671, partial [Aureobasidium melanogenum]
MGLPLSNGSNPSCNHSQVQNFEPSKWCGKIPFVDLPPLGSVTGSGLVSGSGTDLGKQQWVALCKQITTVLSRGIPAKSDWVLNAPANESHAIACTARLYYATVNYINTINDIPNNPPVPSKLPTGPDDEAIESALRPDPTPRALPPEDLYAALQALDFNAAPQEPILDDESGIP